MVRHISRISVSLAALACIAPAPSVAASLHLTVRPSRDGINLLLSHVPRGGVTVYLDRVPIHVVRKRIALLRISADRTGPRARRVVVRTLAGSRVVGARRIHLPSVVPTITLIATPPALTSPNVNVRWAIAPSTARDACVLDGKTTPCAGALSLHGLAAGPHDLSITARSRSGSKRNADVAWRVAAGTVAPPTLTLGSAPSGVVYGTAGATVSWSLGGGESALACTLDGAAVAPCASPLRLEAVAVGAHVVRVRATNAAGSAEATASWFAAGMSPAVFSRSSQGWKPVFTDVAGDARRLRYVVVNSAFKAEAQALKRADPNVRVLLYKNASQTIEWPRAVSDEMSATGVDYFDANTNHPEWFLRTPSGGRVTRHYQADETEYLMDVANSDYQRKFVDNAATQALRDGWDGVFLDDALPTIRFWVASGDPAEVAKYPTDAAWMAATRAFVQAIGSGLHARGLLVFANTCCNQIYHQRSDWAQFLDGTMDEGFVNPTNDYAAQPAYVSGAAWNSWNAFLDEIGDAESAGRVLWTHLRGARSDVERMRYGLATYLLAARGTATFEYHVDDLNGSWFADYDTAIALGSALGPYERLASGVYRRSFARGVVLVNPWAPGTAVRTVALGGAHSGSGLAHVTTASLAPITGLVLLRDAP